MDAAVRMYLRRHTENYHSVMLFVVDDAGGQWLQDCALCENGWGLAVAVPSLINLDSAGIPRPFSRRRCMYFFLGMATIVGAVGLWLQGL